MIDPQLIQQLHTAASYLSARCDGAGSEDGQGFSKFDTTLGKTAANTPAPLWSEAYARKVAKMLTKYVRQLEDGDIHLPELPAAETMSEGKVEVAGGLFVFTFPKEWVDVREAIKTAVDGRRFEPKPFPHWTAPLVQGKPWASSWSSSPNWKRRPKWRRPC